MATRRQCLKRKKKRRLSERSEFRRFPFQVRAARAVRAQRGPPSSGSPFLAYFFWRSVTIQRTLVVDFKNQRNLRLARFP